MWLGGAVALLAAMAAGVFWGPEPLPAGEVLNSLMARGAEGTVIDTIVWRIRLPRVMLAAITGGGLAVVGVAMQALVRNPLAEPYILGISSGASAGAALSFFGFLPAIFGAAVSLPVAAFLGGLLAIAVVLAIAQSSGAVSVARLLLAGVAVSALMAAVTSFVTFVSPDPNKIRSILFWLLGSLDGATWTDIALPGVCALAAAIYFTVVATSLDAMLLGDEPAKNLGVRVEALKRLLVGVTALVTGVLVAQTGAIGFVGLVVPHSIRSLFGVRHRRLVPLSFVAGAAFLVLADLFARTVVRPGELPVGVLTALCGAPFFLFLLRRTDYRFG